MLVLESKRTGKANTFPVCLDDLPPLFACPSLGWHQSDLGKTHPILQVVN